MIYRRIGRSALWGAAFAAALWGGSPALAGDPGDRREEIARLVEQLGSDQASLAQEAAEKLLAFGDEALEALEKAAESKDPLLAERARDLLTRLDQGVGDGEEEREESGFPHLGPLPRFHLQDPERFLEEFEQWQRQWEEELRRFQDEMERFWREAPQGRRSWGRSSFQGTLRMERRTPEGEESLEVKIDPDGKVHARLVREKDGQRTEENYEADSWEEFRRQHPDLARGFGLDLRLGGGGFSFGWPRTLRRLPGTEGRGSRTPFLRPRAGGPRLGIQVREIPDDDPLRLHLGLERGTGLLVERVTPGTLADELGIQRYDILLEVNGRPVDQPAEVREALEERPADQTEVTVLRNGRRITLTKGV